MAIVREFIVTREDSWRSGPYLHMTEEEGYFSNSDDEDYEENDSANAEFNLINDEYHVFHLLFYIGFCETRLLRTFKIEKEAEDYAKQQYFLATGDYPFIADGMNSAYKSTGERIKIAINYDRDIVLADDSNVHEYIIIMDRDIVQAHSLNYFAEW